MESGVMGEDMGGNGDKGGLWGDIGMGAMWGDKDKGGIWGEMGIRGCYGGT